MQDSWTNPAVDDDREEWITLKPPLPGDVVYIPCRTVAVDPLVVVPLYPQIRFGTQVQGDPSPDSEAVPALDMKDRRAHPKTRFGRCPRTGRALRADGTVRKPRSDRGTGGRR